MTDKWVRLWSVFGIFIKENPIIVRKPSCSVTLLTINSPWIDPILCGEKPAVIFGTWHMTCYSLCVARTFFFYISRAANCRKICWHQWRWKLYSWEVTTIYQLHRLFSMEGNNSIRASGSSSRAFDLNSRCTWFKSRWGYWQISRGFSQYSRNSSELIYRTRQRIAPYLSSPSFTHNPVARPYVSLNCWGLRYMSCKINK